MKTSTVVHQEHSGFTLIEFVVVISIMAILAMLFIPGMSSAMRGSDMNAATNELIGGFNLAKLEAIRRGYPVVLCPAAFNASGNLTGCSGLTTWSDGVLIYQDNNLNGNYTENYTIPERVKLIKFSGQFTVNSNPAVSSISFDSKGNLSQAESFCLTKEPYKQVITVNVLGVANSTVTSCAGNTCTTCP